MTLSANLSVIVPVDVPGGPLLSARVDQAGQVDGAAGLDEQLVVAKDGRAGFCSE